jgi:putative DNA primase/helicase
MTAADSLTVLRSVGNRRAAKTFTRQPAGTIKNRGYDDLKMFAVESVPVDSIESLAEALEKVSQDPAQLVIRGEPLPKINRNRTRRLLNADKNGEPPAFREEPRHWLLVDVDHIACPALTDPITDPDGAVEYVIGLLPPELTDATCWWQFSSSQSVPLAAKAGETLSVHLWFWSAEPLECPALKRWATAANNVAGIKLIDPAPFSPVQIHYVARPAFVGLEDPLPRRSGMRRRLDDAVSLVIPEAHERDPSAPSGRGYAPGLGTDSYLAMIGGAEGVRGPIVRAVASYASLWGGNADFEPLKQAIREAIDTADPGGRSEAELDRYRSDEHLDEIIRWEHHGEQPPRAAGNAGGPKITVKAGERHIAADQGIAALHAAGVAFYQRDRALVRVCKVKARAANGDIILVPGIAAVTPAILERALGLAAQWERFDPQKNQPVRIDPPRAVTSQIIDMFGEWPFPPIAGVIGCPTLRRDGSLLADEGYDLATGLVLISAVTMPPIQGAPTRNDAVAAAGLLDELLAEFPFADPTSKSVALSMLMTPVLRGAMTVAPMHLVRAPLSGSGKSYLADTASMIATGERVAVLSAAPNPEETEKRLIGSALAGHTIIGIDNCRETLEGDFLCQVTERPLLELRALGKSDKIHVANTFVIFANGNNVAVADDLVRRTICCSLDANVENPEGREFLRDPLAAIQRNRGSYIAACITIARAYIAAGRPGKLPPLASYEGWSDIVRSSLVWLGYPDPVDTMTKARAADPVRQDRGRAFAAWRDELGVDRGYTTAEIIDHAEERHSYDGSRTRPVIHAVLIEVAQKHAAPGQIEPRRLGRWLTKQENTIAAGLKLTVDRGDIQRPRYRLRRVGA